MKRLTTVITDELNERLKRIAKADGRTLDRYVARLLEAHAKRKDPENEQA